MIWVFMGAPDDEAQLPPIPRAPDLGERAPALIESQIFPCDIDHAVIGLMDPAHGPYVHRSWWWRSKKSMHEKAKDFAPSHLGFTMVRHKPSANSGAYKVLGGEISTEISFQLPGVRIEHIKAGRHTICGMTTVTPLTKDRTEVTTFFYWTLPLLTALRPLLQPFARTFLGQDRAIVEKQQEGLKFAPSLMLIKDADTQARWYHRLKKEWQRAGEEKRPFENPVKAATLRWRS
jgi:phenylpropionate dioxygenase-like ring-hydroxylating dioxygenase large terminal subunit